MAAHTGCLQGLIVVAGKRFSWNKLHNASLQPGGPIGQANDDSGQACRCCRVADELSQGVVARAAQFDSCAGCTWVVNGRQHDLANIANINGRHFRFGNRQWKNRHQAQ